MGKSQIAAIAVLLGGICAASAPGLAQDRMVPASGVRSQGGGFHAGHPGGFAGQWGRGPGRWMRGDGDCGRHGGCPHPRDRDDSRQFYWGGGIAYPEQDWPSPAGTGFFADGEAVRIGNRVVYDYDRGYPYQHSSRQYAAAAETEAPPSSGDYRCTVQWVPGSRGEEASAVRVCRR
jgi:hypothetical protein